MSSPVLCEANIRHNAAQASARPASYVFMPKTSPPALVPESREMRVGSGSRWKDAVRLRDGTTGGGDVVISGDVSRE